MQGGLKRRLRVQRVLLMACCVMILQNMVLIFRQSYDIYERSMELSGKLLASNTVKHSYGVLNNASTKHLSSSDDKWTHTTLTGVVKHETELNKQLKTVPEVQIAQSVGDLKSETAKPEFFQPKNQRAPVRARTHFTPVLIIAYLRSGSTWLGDMIRQSNQTFYVFEPFKPYQHQSYYEVGYICFNNNTCRPSNTSTDRHGFALFTLEQLFNCRFERVASKIVSQISNGLHEGTQMTFTQCLKVMHNSTKCLNYLKRKCFESSHRVIKTIRISMAVVAKLAELVPGLKVIHLLRDPRAITHSRRNGHFSMTFNITSHTQNLCKRLDEDIDVANNLKTKHHEKIVTIIYEALAEYPDTGIQFLYNFLQLPLDEKIFSWMDMSSSGVVNNGYYKTNRKDSGQIARKWRSKMAFNMTLIIDRFCGQVYSSVGYVAMKSVSDLNDINILTRNTNPRNDDSWFQ